MFVKYSLQRDGRCSHKHIHSLLLALLTLFSGSGFFAMRFGCTRFMTAAYFLAGASGAGTLAEFCSSFVGSFCCWCSVVDAAMKVKVLLIPETKLVAASTIHMRVQSLDFSFLFLLSLYGFLSFSRLPFLLSCLSCFFLYSSSSLVISPVQSFSEKPCTFAWFYRIWSTLYSGCFVRVWSSKFLSIGWLGALITFLDY